jgi:hypothetical protein
MLDGLGHFAIAIAGFLNPFSLALALARRWSG